MDGAGLIKLTFSEAVVVSSFNASALHLQASGTDGTTNVQLDAINVAQISHIEIHFTPTVGVMNAIKALVTLAVDEQTTFLRATSETIHDYATNSLAPILASSALAVSSYSADLTSPNCIAFLKMDLSQLILS
jgi:hypothetical protein